VTPSSTPTGTLVLVVNTTDDVDDGTCDQQHCSLREALNAANAQPGSDAIHFNIPGGTPGCDAAGACTIQPESLLLFLTGGNTTIDGYTQPGAELGDKAVLKIVLDGQRSVRASGFRPRRTRSTLHPRGAPAI
jgi:CSLREA domain-containing protein